MRNMKYVLNANTERFLLIPDTMSHNDVLGNWTNAGFVCFYTDEKDECGNVIVKPVCFGKSVSLGLESRGESDAKIIFYGIRDMW